MIKTDPKYKSKRTFSWVSPKVEVRDTKKYGIGIFAKEKILKNEKIAMFGGHVMTREEENQTPEDVYDNAIQIDEDLVIGAQTKEEVEDGSMFNHSCNANAGVRGQILLVAMRNILPKEQITFDFGTVLYHKDGIKPYNLKCLCGEKECRGVITDDDWKNERLQKKYRGYFPLHIQEKIDNIKK